MTTVTSQAPADPQAVRDAADETGHQVVDLP